jgi:Mlc titration factor MtfA (ptsG expression regulator)
MIFGWLRNRRRRRLLAEPFPPAWEEILHDNVPYAARLTGTERDKLRDDLRLLVTEKDWEGCDGVRVSDEMRVTIAGNAALLVLGRGVDAYRRVTSILVYPAAFTVPNDPLLNRDYYPVLGEASDWGPVVLSWSDVVKGVRDPRDGRNVVFHEFAHHLDFLDRAFDGIPDVDSAREHRKWRQIISDEYGRLVEAARRCEVTLIDRYGACNPGEFYAVATECFFERPVEMRKQHPGLYGILRGYYRQDPAARTPGTA